MKIWRNWTLGNSCAGNFRKYSHAGNFHESRDIRENFLHVNICCSTVNIVLMHCNKLYVSLHRETEALVSSGRESLSQSALGIHKMAAVMKLCKEVRRVWGKCKVFKVITGVQSGSHIVTFSLLLGNTQNQLSVHNGTCLCLWACFLWLFWQVSDAAWKWMRHFIIVSVHSVVVLIGIF